MSELARFTYREHGDYKPLAGGIDWYLRRALELKQQFGEDSLPCELWLVFNDGFDLQVTQDNCHVELATVGSEFDRMSLYDPRDESWWVWFRGNDPDTFQNLIDEASPYAKTVETLYPQPDVIEGYLGRLLIKLATDEAEFEHGTVA